jgi:hypothetical protein
MAASTSTPQTWRDDPDAVGPTVLVMGGFLTSPPSYRQMAARLRARGAAEVLIAPVWTPDWLLVARRGLGPVVTRTGRALLRAGEVAGASSASLGAPVLVVGHSAGGITARVLTSPEPFEGRRLGAAGRIGAIVTLGTPHTVSPDGDIGARVHAAGATFAARVVPGAAFAPFVGYVAVASRSEVGRLDGDGRALTAHRFYRGLLGRAAEGRAVIEGDGLIPVESALLDGAVPILLEDTVHGHFGGRPWYGSDERIDRWWPAALDAWHAALRARVAARRRRGDGSASEWAGA